MTKVIAIGSAVMSLLSADSALAQSTDRLPSALIADADASAARFGGVSEAHLQFIQNYARGAIDALIWREDVRASLAASDKICATAQDTQLRTIECGYAEGVAAILTRKIAVTLEDFEYERATVHARVLSDEDGRGKYVQSRDAESWLLAPSPIEEKLEPDDCYRLTGYLGRNRALDPRYAPHEREFIAVDATLADDCLQEAK